MNSGGYFPVRPTPQGESSGGAFLFKAYMQLTPKKWTDFQHYKDRCPPWIKLHRDLLNNRDYICLPLASKALAPLLWLLASETKDGVFDASTEELEFRLRLTKEEILSGLKPLIDKGFFLIASGVLAECLQPAIPETERETEQRHSEKVVSIKTAVDQEKQFNQFWNLYNKKTGKANALKIWAKLNPSEELFIEIMYGCKSYIGSKPVISGYQKDPERWLKGKHWEDEVPQGELSDYDKIMGIR